MKLFFMINLYLFFHSCKATVLIQHFALDDLYMRLRRDYLGEDPVENYDRIQRKEVCDSFLNANVYTFAGNVYPFAGTSPVVETRNLLNLRLSNLNYQEVGHNQGVAEQRLKYQDTYLRIGSISLIIRAFPCMLLSNLHLFLTYGYKPGHFFLINVINADGPFEHRYRRMSALLMPSSKFDESYIGLDSRDLMNNYFWGYVERVASNASGPPIKTEPMDVDVHPFSEGSASNFSTSIEGAKPSLLRSHSSAGERTSSSRSEMIPNDLRLSLSRRYSFTGKRANVSPLPSVLSEMEIRTSGPYQVLAICALVADNLGEYPVFDLNIKKKNNISYKSNYDNVERSLMKDDRSLIIHAKVLPCVVNRSLLNPNFYLLRDPNLPASVFVFRSVDDETHGNVLRLEGKVDDVEILTFLNIQPLRLNFV